MIELSPQRRRELRAQAHALHPVVSVGQHGLTAQVMLEIDVALRAHGLIKIRVFSDDRDQRDTMLAQIAGDLGASPVQHVGKVLIVWRTPEEAPAKAEPRAKAKPRKERGAKGAKRSSKDSAAREPRAASATRRRTTDPTYNDRGRARTPARDEPGTAKKRAPRNAEEALAPDARRRRRPTGVPATKGAKRPRDAAFGVRGEKEAAPKVRRRNSSAAAPDRAPTGKSAPSPRRRRRAG